MDERMLDGNAAAGSLQEVFAPEITAAVETCGKCGAAAPIGTLRVFQGAGVVLRCPHCDDVLMTIVRDDEQVCIGFAGVQTLRVVL